MAELSPVSSYFRRRFSSRPRIFARRVAHTQIQQFFLRQFSRTPGGRYRANSRACVLPCDAFRQRRLAAGPLTSCTVASGSPPCARNPRETRRVASRAYPGASLCASRARSVRPRSLRAGSLVPPRRGRHWQRAAGQGAGARARPDGARPLLSRCGRPVCTVASASPAQHPREHQHRAPGSSSPAFRGRADHGLVRAMIAQ